MFDWWLKRKAKDIIERHFWRGIFKFPERKIEISVCELEQMLLDAMRSV